MTRNYFGTDGIRGIAGRHPMTASFAFQVGAAATEVLKAAGHSTPHLLVGQDTRRSSTMLAYALASGVMARGGQVSFLGVMPTPGVSHLTQALAADAGVVISASHNPFEDNGIKFFNRHGQKLSDALELQIEAQLAQLETLPEVSGAAIGSAQHRHDAEERYLNFLLAHAPYLDGLKVGLDCANGASYQLAPRLFQKIGARLDVIHAAPDGLNINLKCGSTHPEALQQRVTALGLEVGITFDGDADRALLVDRRGRLVSGDHILAICAVVRGERAVVATVMTNLGVERYLAEHGIDLIRAQVGDRYVHAALEQHQLKLGGEQSGHVLFLDKAPTGDGLLTALQTLAAVRKSGKSLEQWLDEIPLYPQTLINVPVTPGEKQRLVDHPQVRAALAAAQAQLGEAGRINVRPSGTEPLIRVMVEGPEATAIAAIAQELAAVIAAAGAEAA